MFRKVRENVGAAVIVVALVVTAGLLVAVAVSESLRQMIAMGAQPISDLIGRYWAPIAISIASLAAYRFGGWRQERQRWTWVNGLRQQVNDLEATVGRLTRELERAQNTITNLKKDLRLQGERDSWEFAFALRLVQHPLRPGWTYSVWSNEERDWIKACLRETDAEDVNRGQTVQGLFRWENGTLAVNESCLRGWERPYAVVRLKALRRSVDTLIERPQESRPRR